MKNFVFLILLSIYLNSFSLEITKFRYEGKTYNLVHLKDSHKIECNTAVGFDQSKNIACDVNSDKNESKSFDLFSFYTSKNIYFKTKNQYKIVSFKNNNIYYKDIIFFKGDDETFGKKDFKGLNFDVKLNKPHKFYISVLDENLKPDMTIMDANKLSYIRELVKKNDYYSVVRSIDRELKRGSNFESDLLLLKLETLDKLLLTKDKKYSYSDIVKISDKFLKKYPSSSDFTKVMYIKIKALFKIGKKKQAIDLAKKLDDSFKDDKYSELSQIEMAKFLYNIDSKRSDSYKILKYELYNTKNISIALKSAYLLTKYSLKDKKIIDAKIYIDKILNSDQKYFLKDKKESYKLAKGFASLKDFKNAVRIAEILKKKMKSEEFLKNLAFWKDRAGEKDDAYKEYKAYLKEYPKGQFANFVNERMQKVLIDVKESNFSKKIADIDSVMKKYSKDPIYKKALIKKVELLKEKKKYADILKLEKKLKDINETKYLDFSANELFKSYIDKDSCSKAVNLVDRYKVIIKNFDRLYKLAYCYYGLAFYKESSVLTSKFLKSHSDNIAKWYYLAIKSFIKLEKYDKAIELFKDFKKIEDVDNSKYSDIYYDIFDIYYAKKDRNSIFNSVEKIEKLFPRKSKNLDVYYKTINYLIGKKSGNLLIIYYAKKLLNLQKELKVNTYSVQVDVILVQSLVRLGKNNEALKYFADAYLDKSKSDSQKGELLYLAGEASLKLKKIKQAKEFFTKCGTDIKSKMWQKLCSESLKLIDEP